MLTGRTMLDRFAPPSTRPGRLAQRALHEEGSPGPRVALVSDLASLRMGGEAALAVQWFAGLRARGVDVTLIGHGRNREELEALFPQDRDRLLLVPADRLHRALFRAGRPLPHRVKMGTTRFASHLYTQALQRRELRRLIGAGEVDIVHQTMPVSPQEPSLLYGLGVPVVIGPLNGGLEFPPAFRERDPWLESVVTRAARAVGERVNRWIPGKQQADLVLVANERTRRALPPGIGRRVATLTENGADVGLWRPAEDGGAADDDRRPLRFVFMGRFVAWKGLDLLLEAFAQLRRRRVTDRPLRLEVWGHGVAQPRYEELARRLGVAPLTRFRGWLSKADSAARLRRAAALVLPSLWECGGAVVLEAMASGVPVIAAAWGGPAEYLDERCGILVPPHDRDALVGGLVDGMERLIREPALRARMGAAGRRKVLQRYAWDAKVERMLALYQETLRRARGEVARG